MIDFLKRLYKRIAVVQMTEAEYEQLRARIANDGNIILRQREGAARVGYELEGLQEARRSLVDDVLLLRKEVARARGRADSNRQDFLAMRGERNALAADLAVAELPAKELAVSAKEASALKQQVAALEQSNGRLSELARKAQHFPDRDSLERRIGRLEQVRQKLKGGIKGAVVDQLVFELAKHLGQLTDQEVEDEGYVYMKKFVDKNIEHTMRRVPVVDNREVVEKRVTHQFIIPEITLDLDLGESEWDEPVTPGLGAMASPNLVHAGEAPPAQADVVGAVRRRAAKKLTE